MIGRITLGVWCLLLAAPAVQAQDVPGIEICTVEKTMERRTSCLQSNVDFLMKTIAKLNSDHQIRMDAAARQVEALRAAVAGLQKTVDDLKAQAKTSPAASASGKETPATTPAAKEAGK